MSYGIMPYRVSLERLRSRLGTQDEARRGRLREVCLKKAKDMDRLGGGTPPFMEIVEELLDGKATHNTGYLYWYAMKCFVDDLGVMLDNSKWYPTSADVFWGMEGFALYGIGASFKIPEPDDFPVVFVLAQENVNSQLINNLEEKIDSQSQKNQLINWIKEAQTYEQDLVLFYH